MACCPFHQDKNPSLKVDKRFHCFGCQADGDVIDFTARLFDLSAVEAAKKLAADFGISYGNDKFASPKPVKKSISKELRILQAEQKCFRVLSDYYHLEAVQKREYVGYLLDLLLTGTAEEKAAVIMEQGKEVKQLERRISEFAGSHADRPGSCRRQPER